MKNSASSINKVFAELTEKRHSSACDLEQVLRDYGKIVNGGSRPKSA